MAEPAPGSERSRTGCVAAGALFAIVTLLGWLIAITAYGLVVEQWEMIEVRREFSYDWVFLWAPLFAVGLGLAAALPDVAARGGGANDLADHRHRRHCLAGRCRTVRAWRPDLTVAEV